MVRSLTARARSVGAAALLVLALSACTPVRTYMAPTFPFLKSYTAASAGASVVLDNQAWWRRLKDPQLDRLIDLSLTNNLSLALARERVIAAQEARNAVPGAAAITSSTGVRLQGTGSDSTELRGTGNVGLSWVFDPWGERRETLRAASAQVDIAEAEVDAAQLLMLYTTSNAYIDLRYRQRLLVLAQQDLSRGLDALGQTRERMKAQSATRQDVTRARARVASIRAQMPGLEAAVAGKINEITVLTGRAPGTLAPDLVAGLRGHQAQPRPTMSADVGIPADLLRNRPDVRIAERGYYVALAQLEVARTGLYPKLSLTGLISLTSLSTGSGRPQYYLGPSIEFPSLPLRSAKASIALRHSQARQAHEIWKSTVLTAILEVENALLDYAAVRRALGSAGEATRLYRETVSLTQELLKSDDATVSDLLDAQREVAQAARSEAELRQRYAQSFVEINVRLGAGHSAGTPVAPAVAPKAVGTARSAQATLTSSD